MLRLDEPVAALVKRLRGPLYEDPGNLFVADFLGDANILRGRALHGGIAGLSAFSLLTGLSRSTISSALMPFRTGVIAKPG